MRKSLAERDTAFVIVGARDATHRRHHHPVGPVDGHS
jgi:hypothetical protein